MTTRRIFDGIKVVDFGWVGVGPISAKHLADHGATVIRVESTQRPDVLRLAGPFAGGKPGINRSQFWADYNSSKLSVGLNLATETGRALARRLVVEWADVVVEGYTPKQMRAWGLHYEDLSRDRPDLVMLSTSQMGQTGPYNLYAGYGTQAAALAGYYNVTGWPDRPPVVVYGAYTDMLTPHFNVALLAAALDRRRRTGRGLWIDTSQMEVGILCQGAAVLDYTANGRVAVRKGNRDDRAIPHGVFPCGGEDRWVAIAVFTDEQWKGLCRVIERDELASDPAYATAARRREHEGAIEELIAAWTRQLSPQEAMARLQAVGVPAGAVLWMSDLHEDPHIRHWGFFEWPEHPVIGAAPYDGFMSHFSKTPGRLDRAPKIAEHTEHVMREVLRLSDEEIGQMLATEAIEFPPE